MKWIKIVFTINGRYSSSQLSYQSEEEKEQIIDAYRKPTGMKHNEKWVNMFTKKAEQYYNETYGKDESNN